MQRLIPLLFLLGLPLITICQSSLYEYGNRTALRLEFNKPLFDDPDNEIGFFTLGNFLNAQFPLSDKVALHAEIPFAFISVDDESESAVGNITVGLNYYAPSNRFKLHFGFGIPTAGTANSANIIGLLSDFTERISSFYPDVIPLELTANFYNQPLTGVTYRIRTGLEALIAQNDAQDTEVFFLLTPQIGYAFNGGVVFGGISTITSVTGEGGSLGDRLVSSILVGGEFNAGNFRPGIHFKIPLDDELTLFYDVLIGVSLGYIF